jgi:hypothetical protein
MLLRPQINQNSPAMETNSSMIARSFDQKNKEAQEHGGEINSCAAWICQPGRETN